MNRAELGRKGEAAAALYYEKQGYTLYAHNFHCREGELDLVLTRDELLVVAEVKSRSSAAFAQPREAVTPAKQRRLILACQRLLEQLPPRDWHIRFDVVEVLPREEGGFAVHCFPDAFRAQEM